MPELPEVETTVRALVPAIIGRTIVRVQVLRPNMVGGDSRAFETALTDKKIRAITRRGKYMLVDMGDRTLLLHLRMSGRLGLRTPDEPELTYERIRFYLDDKRILIFNDPRTLGRALILKPGDADGHPLLAKLGPDALDIDAWLFAERIRTRRTPVKVALLDQSFIAGVGNIYAQEACFIAGIDPRRDGADLSEDEAMSLFKAMNQTLEHGIENMGTSFSDFADLFGKPGQNQTSLWVYGRADESCRKCGGKIESITQAQRTTAWCRRCQK